MWTYRGSFGVNEVDLHGNAGPGFDKLKSFKFSGINTTWSINFFFVANIWRKREQVPANRFHGCWLREVWQNAPQLCFQTMYERRRPRDFPWYLNMQIDIRNDNLAIYYLNKKHTSYEYRGKSTVETNSYKAFVMLVVMGA